MELRVAGKYRLLKKLGSGAFGVIYHGIDLEKHVGLNVKTNDEVAIKLVRWQLKGRNK